MDHAGDNRCRFSNDEPPETQAAAVPAMQLYHDDLYGADSGLWFAVCDVADAVGRDTGSMAHDRLLCRGQYLHLNDLYLLGVVGVIAVLLRTWRSLLSNLALLGRSRQPDLLSCSDNAKP